MGKVNEVQLASIQVTVTLLWTYADSLVAEPDDFVMFTTRVGLFELPKKFAGAPVAVAVAAVVATRLRVTVCGVASSTTLPVEADGFASPLALTVKPVVVGT